MSAARGIRPGDQIDPIEKRVTQEVIDAWADVSGDYNPLHVDPAYAKTTRFGGTIAHGHIALGWLTEMMVRWQGAGWLNGGELRGIRFVAPIRPGYTVRARGVVRELIDEDGVPKALCDVTIVNAADGQPCAVGTGLVVLER